MNVQSQYGTKTGIIFRSRTLKAGICPSSYLPKRKNPSVTPFQNPSVGFQSKIKNQARSAALRVASLAMSTYANLIKSSGLTVENIRHMIFQSLQ